MKLLRLTRRRSALLIALLVGFAILVVSVVSTGAFGSNPEGARLEKMMKSSHYDAQRDRFRNRKIIPNNGLSDDATYSKLLKQWFFSPTVRRPTTPLAEVQPDFESFGKIAGELSYIWFGHSTFLVRIGGKTVLFDPVFGSHASPVPVFGKRFQPPVVGVAALPHIDFVVISHDHYDHLDMPSIRALKGRKDLRFFVPLGVGAHLEGWGVAKSRITELQWWESAKAGGLELTCTPSKHFSGRSLTDRNRTLWASWVVAGPKERLYFSGDSGYDVHFKQIGRRHGPFDVVFLENGQYNPMWKHVHMLPEQGAQAFADLGGGKMMPMHWGMFDLAPHNWWDPIESARTIASRRGHNLLTPRIGETVRIGAEQAFTTWWRASVPADRRSFAPLVPANR